jgi:ornithine carbamoyltransferase
MAMTTKSRMSRAMVMRLAMCGAAIPRGWLRAVAAFGIDIRVEHPNADSMDYPRRRASAQLYEDDG